jgi:hypothetical protein
MQVVDHGTAAQITPVLALPARAGASTLPVADMGQGLLDRHPLAQLGASCGRLLAGPQLGQERLVGMDVHAAAMDPRRTLGA